MDAGAENAGAENAGAENAGAENAGAENAGAPVPKDSTEAGFVEGDRGRQCATAPPIAAPDLTDSTGEVYLDDTWALWFHDPDDPDWTNASYVQIAAISSANNFWAVQSMLSDKVQNGMFFLMREHVFPCWDDPYNAQGGCLSVKVPNHDATRFWEDLSAAMLSDNLARAAGQAESGGHDGDPPKASDHVNGLSITPKGAFCVFKLWLGEAAPKDPAAYAIPSFQGQALFKSHAACMVDASNRPGKHPPPRR